MRFDNSNECMKSELDLFSVPPTQTSLENGVWNKIEAATGNNSDKSTVQFKIPPSGDSYLDLSETFLHLKCSIKKKSDNNVTLITAADAVGPVNNFLHSMFEQVEVKINGTSVENSNKYYAYRAYIDKIINSDQTNIDTNNQNELFYLDTAGKFESVDLKNDDDEYEFSEANKSVKFKKKGAIKVNDGFLKRKQRFIDSNGEVELCGKIHLNLSTLNKYILNNVEVTITLTRSSPVFSLMGSIANTEFLIYIDTSYLRYRCVKFNPSIGIAHALALEKTNAKYQFKDIKMNSGSIKEGAQKLTLTNIHSGFIPNKIVIGFVDGAAYSGSSNLNPFNFQHFDLEKILIKVGGKNIPYHEDLEFDYKKKKYALAYNTLFQALDKPCINYSDYMGGYTLYCFNLTPDLCSMNNFNTQTIGDLQIELKFAEKTEPKTIEAIVYLEFDNIIEISKQRVASYTAN